MQKKSEISCTIERLQKRLELLEKREQSHVQAARKFAKEMKKTQALNELKKKKLVEKEKAKLCNAITNLEHQVLTIEGAMVTQDIVSAMRTGKDAMKQTMKNVDVEKVEDLKDDITDLQMQQDEVDQLLCEGVPGFGIDDDEIEAELQELDDLEIDESINNLPEVPKSSFSGLKVLPPPVANQDDEDADALRELEKEMLA